MAVVTVHENSIRSQSTINPVHTAPVGTLHLNTENQAVFVQTAIPQGSTWQCLTQPFVAHFVIEELEMLTIIDYGSVVIPEI